MSKNSFLYQVRQKLSECWPFFRHVANRFNQDHCFHVAATLTVTSLLSLVPVMAVTVSVLAMFPAFQRFGRQLQEFIFDNFVPSFGVVVQEHLLGFVDQALKLRVIGTLLFIATALLLIAAIDHALNNIWQVKTQRPVSRTLLAYWAVITLGPLLLGASIGLTSYFFSISGITEMAWFQRFFYTLMPWAFTATALSILYVMMPNRTVSFAHGVTGGVVAAGFFELAKIGFAAYVSWVPTYELVFGTLAAVPLFVLWVNLSWLIFLLGAEITHALSVYRSQSRVFLQDKLTVSFHFLRYLWQAHQEGENLGRSELLSLEPGLAEDTFLEVLDGLTKAHLVTILPTGRYQLARDLRSVTLAQLHRALPWCLPRQQGVPASDSRSAIEARYPGYVSALQRAWQALDDVLDTPLETLYRENDTCRENDASTGTGSEISTRN
jgi:membrane protein